MATPNDLSRFCCQNEKCSRYGRRGDGNLTVSMYYGKDRRRMLYCSVCKKRFSERKGTPLFDSRLSEDQALAVLQHIADGCGVRQTGRLVGVTKDTVVRYSVRAGGHAQTLHDELVAFSPRNPRSAIRRKMELRSQKSQALRSRRSRGR